jgi:tetratricopeptide (TPR) repeat protein
MTNEAFQILQVARESCEAAIRAGNVDEARQMLAALNTTSAPRELRLPLAHLCRRVGLTQIGMRLLDPIVFPEKGGPHLRLENKATAPEMAEYAVLLQRCGGVEEALRILNRIDSQKFPDALLYQAYCHFNQWDYRSAHSVLEDYLKHSMEPYQALIGRVNLAAALIGVDQIQEAIDLLNQNISDAKAASANRLLGNCYELLGQAQVLSEDFISAEANLALASGLLTGDGSQSELAVMKWQAVIEASRSRSLTPLRKFRALAEAARDWESVRHADFQILRFDFDEKLFHHLLCGSASALYRERVQRALGQTMTESEYIFGEAEAPCLDLTSGKFEGRVVFKKAGKIHQALAVLLKDFYQPRLLGAVFAELFPGEHFDVLTSPSRVHQNFYRLREWISKENLPLEVLEEEGTYAIKIRGPFRFRIPYRRMRLDVDQQILTALREKFSNGQLFSAREGALATSVPLLTFRKFLSRAVSSDDLMRLGAGPSTQYHLNIRRT